MTVAKPRASSRERYWWPQRPPADPVLEGLAVNPAVPDELMLRLVREHGGVAAQGLARRAPVSATVLAAMLSHPEPWVRSAAGANPSVDPEIRLSLLDDPDHLVRDQIENQPDLVLPEAALARRLERWERFLVRGIITPEELRNELADEAFHERRLMPLLARHHDERFRLIACSFAEHLEEPDRQALMHDVSPEIRTQATAHLAERARPRTPADLHTATGHRRFSLLLEPLSPELIDEMLAEASEEDLIALALNRHLPPDAVTALTTNPSVRIRRHTAQRHDLTEAQAVRLGADPDPAVRTTASVHPVLAEAQRAAIDIDPDAYLGQTCAHLPTRPDWLPTPTQPAILARSLNPLLRRHAAQDPQLPEDLAATLADDPDQGVRLLLALHHPAAPPALLLRSYLDHGGCVRHRLLDRPHFPTTGLARFATHPDPAIRRLIVRDPHTDPATVERMLNDPDETVRKAMAGSPRLPPLRIIALLDHPELNTTAAANPALPETEMERLLTHRHKR